MPADSSDIDAALVAKLLADAPLMALAVDGVAFDIAPQGATKFVIVSLLASTDTPMFRGRAYETGTYLVKFVEKGTSGLNAKSAAARIDAVLDGASLTIPGYTLMNIQRIERVRITEVDDVDNAIRWQHRGGLYEITACA